MLSSCLTNKRTLLVGLIISVILFLSIGAWSIAVGHMWGSPPWAMLLRQGQAAPPTADACRTEVGDAMRRLLCSTRSQPMRSSDPWRTRGGGSVLDPWRTIGGRGAPNAFFFGDNHGGRGGSVPDAHFFRDNHGGRCGMPARGRRSELVCAHRRPGCVVGSPVVMLAAVL